MEIKDLQKEDVVIVQMESPTGKKLEYIAFISKVDDKYVYVGSIPYDKETGRGVEEPDKRFIYIPTNEKKQQMKRATLIEVV